MYNRNNKTLFKFIQSVDPPSIAGIFSGTAWRHVGASAKGVRGPLLFTDEPMNAAAERLEAQILQIGTDVLHTSAGH